MKDTKKDPFRALNDPLRISLFELIKEGQKSTPELAEILGKNRMELYHHLKILERSGLIKSSYNSDRVKVYRIQSSGPGIEHLQQTTHIAPSKEDNMGVIILSPPSDINKYKRFKELIDKASQLCGSKIPNRDEIIQVHVRTESQIDESKNEGSIYQFKRTRAGNN